MFKDQSVAGETLDLFGLAPVSAPLRVASELPTGAVMLASGMPGYLPVRSLETLDEGTMTAALNRDAVARRVASKGMAPTSGDVVGIRLNLNVLKSTGVAVHTVHKGGKTDGYTRNKGLWSGEVLCYAQTVTLKRAYFNVHQVGREAIASGSAAKHPMASVDGILDSLGDDADFGGIEISFNPRSVHLFVDPSMRAVRYADEVSMRGHRCYARGRIVLFDGSSWIAPAGDSPSAAKPYALS